MTNPTSALRPQNGFSAQLSSPMTNTDTVAYLSTLPTANEGYLTIDEGLTTQEVFFFNSKGSNFVTIPSLSDRGLQGSSNGVSAHSAGASVKMKVVAQYLQALADGYGLNPAFLGAWTLYTPTLTNITLGNGSTSFYYVKIGKTVHFYGRFVFGSTSSISTAACISLPFPSDATTYNAAYQNIVGDVWYSVGTNVAGALSVNTVSTNTAAQLIYTGVVGGNTQLQGVGPANPGTWVAGSYLTAKGTYQVA